VSNPVPPPGGAYPPAGQGQPGQPGYPPAGGQPGYPPAGQPGYPGQPGYSGQPGSGQPGYPGQPGYNQPGQGQSAPGQPGFDPTSAPGYPPAGQGGYPPAGQPGYAPGGQGGYQPGQVPGGQGGYPPPLGQPGQPGFPPPGGEAPPAFGGFPEEKKKGGAGKVVLRIGAAIVVALVIAGLKFGIASAIFGGDDAKDAKAGDCIASGKQVKDEGTTKTDADVVDCTSSDAKFTVVARVDGESSPDSKSCDKFFKEGEEFYVFGSTSGDGYLLCLRPKA
jgi:hypothetical protein